ncbi:MAG: hypothetical protein H6719_10035 [Sandaracinaceae bacterium]|nr:hypothetical protein [Sandaracinaceae bacterium]
MRSLLLALVILFAPLGAAAQDVVVLSLGGDAPAATAREAREATAAALQEDGLEVLPDADLGLRMPPSRLAACQRSACAWTIGRELEVSMVAAVATWMTDGQPSSITVSLIVGPDRSHTATEELGDRTLTVAAREAVTAAQAARGRALIIEGTTRPEQNVETPELPAVTEDGQSTTQGDTEPRTDDPLHAERSLEEWILPSVLGVVGLGLIGASVYAMLDVQCDAYGGSGVCLRGTEPNYGLGVVMAALGGLSLVGALVWLIIGGTPSSQGQINMVLGPQGVGARF